MVSTLNNISCAIHCPFANYLLYKFQDTFLDGLYEYHPAVGEFGSSKYYSTRQAILSAELRDVPYDKVLAFYGNSLVMVASREERWNALAGHMPVTYLYQLTQIQYCILELIGKGRHNVSNNYILILVFSF